MKGLCALSKELALKNCFFSFFNLQCWVLSSRTKQSFTAIMDSRHICHVVSPWEVIDFLFFFPRFESSNESIDQGGSAAVYKSWC